MARAKTISELRQLSRDDLIAQHDSMTRDVEVGISYYLQELARRDDEEANKQMIGFTKQMRNFTIVILILTAINLAVFVGSFLTG